MNRQDILKLNVVPEGREPWLDYESYLKLGQLFDAGNPPGQDVIDGDYAALYNFLVAVAGLELPLETSSIHFNAFTLLRRGYKVEEITETEYKDLVRLIAGLEQPDKNDMDLYDSGGHRDLYTYLTQRMGLFVQAGRGPVWYRAQALIDRYRLLERISSTLSGPAASSPAHTNRQSCTRQ